jgi:hypothetical protein
LSAAGELEIGGLKLPLHAADCFTVLAFMRMLKLVNTRVLDGWVLDAVLVDNGFGFF